MEERKRRTRLSKDDALDLMQKYCVYQDRCQSEIRTRLIEHGVYGDDLEEVIAELISDDFINEERFAKSYTRGKFKIKGWGRIKILKELKFRKISDYSIKKGMLEIDEDDYYEKLYRLLEKKLETLNESDIWMLRKKLTSFGTQKGYEYDIIKEVVNSLVNKGG